jgi:hypothetical protein
MSKSCKSNTTLILLNLRIFITIIDYCHLLWLSIMLFGKKDTYVAGKRDTAFFREKYSCQTSVHMKETTTTHISNDRNLHIQRHENAKSRLFLLLPSASLHIWRTCQICCNKRMKSCKYSSLITNKLQHRMFSDRVIRFYTTEFAVNMHPGVSDWVMNCCM